MELRKIIEGINSSWVLHVFSVDFITESSEKLLQYLLKLKFNKETEEYYLFQFPQGGYPAIRVFGHFLNAIKIYKMEMAPIYRIRLCHYPDSPADINRTIRADEYHLLIKEYEKFIPTTNIRAYLETINSLRTIFIGTEHLNEYENFINEAKKESESLQNWALGLSNCSTTIEEAFRELFKGHEDYDDKTGGFFIFPDNAVIRYRGFYHNCIGYDGYSVSLGYIKEPDKNYYLPEESFNVDSYTVMDDENRYITVDRCIIQNLISLEISLGTLTETVHVLDIIDRLYRDMLQKGELYFVPISYTIDVNKRQYDVMVGEKETN